MDVSGISPAAGFVPGTGSAPGRSLPAGKAANGDPPFAKAINDALHDVNARHTDAQQQIAGLATGEVDNLHDVVLSVARADLAFQLVLEIRNRLISSYQELMRMQV